MKLILVAWAIVAVILGIGWLGASISVEALLYYMEKKGCASPTGEEVDECVKMAVRRKFSKKS